MSRSFSEVMRTGSAVLPTGWTKMFIRRSHGCMNDSVFPSDAMRKYARSGLRKKSFIGMRSRDCASADTDVASTSTVPTKAGVCMMRVLGTSRRPRGWGDGERGILNQQRQALLVERPETEPLVEAPGAGVGAVASGVDAHDAASAKMCDQRREHRRPDPLSASRHVDGDVVELRDERAAGCRDRVADDACAKRRVAAAGEPDEAELGPREEEVERPLERLRAAVAIRPRRGTVMIVAGEECTEQAQRVYARLSGHRRALRCVGLHVPLRAARSGSSAARIASGTGTGRRSTRSTHTCTKRPVAAASS